MNDFIKDVQLIGHSTDYLNVGDRYQTGNVNYNDATVMTGIKWYWSSGNWESGTIKIYGVND